MKSNESGELSRRQLQVLPYLLSSPSYEEAARRAGINVKQIFAWMKNTKFKQELRLNQGLIFAEAISALKAATQSAVQTLIACLADQDSRVRLSAAEKILVNAYKGLELYELEERLRVIESRIAGEKSDETKLSRTFESGREHEF
jgi:hypothetical protein